MTCELTLQGQLVIGGGTGCSGTSGGGATKVQQLGLACAAAFESIGSTDCPVTISSPSEFVPLPVGGPKEISLLFVSTTTVMVLRWGGTKGVINGDTVLGGVTFTGGETFVFTSAGTQVTVTFSAGSFTLQQVRDIINAEAISAGLGYLPITLNDAATALILSSEDRGGIVSVDTAQSLIGFTTTTSDTGDAPTEASIKGTFLSQFDPAVTGVEIKGSGEVSVLAAGAA